MKNTNIKVSILPNQFLQENGTFNLNEALKLSGKIAGICYDKEGFAHLLEEPEKRTDNRINMTLDNGHHSVYDHIMINFNIKNLPKILAMVLNNEHQYTTSEKSARYTPIVRTEDSYITEIEEQLYNKWLEIFKIKIKEQYGYIYNDAKIKKLAQENARYLVTVFMPTEMIYSTTLRQINYLVSWMNEYIANVNPNNSFEQKLANSMQDLIVCFQELNVLEDRLLSNDKCRKISLFGKNIYQQDEYFGQVYSTKYMGSLAQLAQAQRHRTLDYQLEFTENKEYYIPPIIADDWTLVEEWLHDMETVKEFTPQGELVIINETGKYEDFILKCKERLCSAAQIEIMRQTRETLLKYQASLNHTNHPLSNDIKNYTRGARCTFPDFTCQTDCKFAEGKRLTRKI